MYSLLIVDDEPTIIEGMRHILDWSFYRITRIESARCYDEALERAIDLSPDICLFDVCIGKEKGYDLVRRISSLGIKSNYIMMSGYAELQYAIESMRYGAAEYLLKPVETQRLKDAVERIIVNELGGSIHKNKQEQNIEPVLQIPYTALPPLTSKVALIVRTQYMDKLTLKSIAQIFRMNSTYLGQIFLKETRLKFSEYLMIFRLLKAKELIETTDDKIASIAGSVGYSNLNYFYSHFHTYFKVSPGDLRGNGE